MTEREQAFADPILRDGVEDAEEVEWQDRFAQKGVLCLTDAFCAFERTLQEGDGLREETEAIRKGFCENRRRWVELLSHCLKTVQAPRGVFVSKADRETAHKGALELLLLAESVRSAYGALLVDCVTLSEKTAQWERNLEAAVFTLSRISPILKDVEGQGGGDLLLRHTVIGENLLQARKKATDLKEMQMRLSERLQTAALREVSSACQRVSDLADLSHNGERCDITGLSVLLAALISAADDTL